MRNSQHSSAGRRGMTLADWFGVACLILLAACSVILLIRLMGTQMLTQGLLIGLVAALAVLNLIHLAVQLPRRRSGAKVVAGVLALVLSAGMVYAVSAADSVQRVLMNISASQSTKEYTYIIVMKDDKARDIGDAMGYRFGALDKVDQENTSALLEAVKDGLGEVESTPYNAINDLADALYTGQEDAIILNQGYIALLEKQEAYADFSEKTRILYEFATTKEVEPIAPNPLITREPFVVYCSGIDSRYTDINTKSLSDVNILAVVNPETHQVLLLNTPRDYYVPMVSEPYAGMLDKLTHAGSTGIEESMAVLGQLYGVEAKYYIRVNFTGLIDIVDALGGVEVVSPKEFTTRPMQIVAGGAYRPYYFTEGVNKLNGEEALAFSRERDSFSDGDNQRGKNQMAVIRGIVDKATSPQILSSYDQLLKAAEGCFLTNMPYEDMSALVKMQLRDMTGWNITTYAVSGDGDMQPCASYGSQNLWVMWPDEDMINIAKDMVQQVMDGQVPTLPAA